MPSVVYSEEWLRAAWGWKLKPPFFRVFGPFWVGCTDVNAVEEIVVAILFRSKYKTLEMSVSCFYQLYIHGMLKCNCCIMRPNSNAWRMCGTLNLSGSYRNSCIIHSLCRYVSLMLLSTYQQSSVSLGLVRPDSFWNWALNYVTNGELPILLNNN